ncbi:hypothetical protein ABZY81_15280 [Streptomyces sp. NPDC006514]|uniref:hypothetical protein n=1 Tax=Streptomyces sp. NPDC006514 TaxID=3154308 RepID=UPI0033A337DA
MPRPPDRARRLVVDGDVYTWSVRHAHHRPATGPAEDCRETVTVHLAGAPGCLRVDFRKREPGQYSPSGYLGQSGEVARMDGGSLNLYEPGTALALMKVARAQGWQPAGASKEFDGWTLFDATVAARPSA